jgi:hypothetical protein
MITWVAFRIGDLIAHLNSPVPRNTGIDYEIPALALRKAISAKRKAMRVRG